MRLNQMIDYLRYTGAKALYAMYNSLQDDSRRLFLDAIRFRIIDWEEDERRSMINKLVAMNISKPDYNCMIMLHKAHFLENGAGVQRIGEYIESFGANQPDLLCIMIDEALDITPFLKACSDIAGVINSAFKNIIGFGDKLRGYDPEIIKDNDLLLDLTKVYIQATVNAAESEQDIEKFAALSGSYAMKYLQVFGETYVPEEVLAAVTVEEVNIFRRRRDYKSCIAGLRRLIQLNKRFGTVAKAYQAVLKTEAGAV